MMDEDKVRLQKLFKLFIGTKKYHNYTKDVKSHQTTAMRFMMNLDCSDFVYINRDTLEVTNEFD